MRGALGAYLMQPTSAHSTAMLLEHLGEAAAARRVMQAIEHVTADRTLHTRDLGGTATTAAVTRAVCERVRFGHPGASRDPERR